MNTTPRQSLFGLLACFGALTAAAWAQTAPAPADQPAAGNAPAAASPSTTATSAPATPAHVTAVPAPAESTATASASTAAAPEPAPSATTAAAARAAGPAPAAAATAAEASSSTANASSATPSSTATTSGASAEAAETTSDSLRRLDAPTKPAATGRHRNRHFSGVQSTGNDRFALLHNSDLGQGESAGNVVAVLGNATSAGNVSESVVAVLGNARSTGQTGDSVVAVLGNSYVDGPVGGDVVCVLGNVELGPKAVIEGDLVNIGGDVHRDPKAIVHGDTPVVPLPHLLGFAGGRVQTYVRECLLKARFLGFAPGLGWAWMTAAATLGFYVLLALLFRRGVESSVATLETRPGGAILTSILMVLLIPLVTILLVITVVGIAVLPFAGIALACLGVFGRVVMLAWLGGRLTKLFAGTGPLAHPAFGVLLGGIIVMLLYTVPVLSFIVYKLIGVLGLGVVIYSLILSSRRNRPAAPAPRPMAAGVAPMAPTAGAADIPPMSAAFAAATAEGPAVATAPAVAPAVVAAASLPRAGFWIRTAALLIDLVLVLIASAMVHLAGFFLPALAIYGAVMWKTKGTTIGGIICGLRVVRLDDRPVDWPTAAVRSLGCVLSAGLAFLGFIWVAIDDEKQSWHDKIAGTVVVHARGGSLV